ncbi:MAG: MerR family transcriptional regulator, partial [Bacteriovorax sp.]|nr:MerR family transcriptional regulator [Bacteriovorax sp.]
MWERRYSFPRPERDIKGERVYTNHDVEKLKTIKLLMQEGYRPSKVINQKLEELHLLLKSFNKESLGGLGAVYESVILITLPSLEQDVRNALKNHNVKKILVISTLEDVQNLSL